MKILLFFAVLIAVATFLYRRSMKHQEGMIQQTADKLFDEKIIVLDVETQFLSSEVDGGWDAIPDFLMAVAVTWDKSHEFRTWYEDDAARLVAELTRFEKILTFNGNRFDFKVLSRYGPTKELKKKSIDLHAFVYSSIRKRIPLDSLAEANLGNNSRKSMTGVEAVQLWRSGDPEKRQMVVEYCRKDVEILINLHLKLHCDCLRIPLYSGKTTYLYADGSRKTL